MPIVLLSLLLVLLTAPAAQAADVSAARIPDGPGTSGPDGIRIELTARPGERNDVRVQWPGLGVELRDAGAPLVAGSGCEQLDEHAVRCAAGFDVMRLAAYLGDGDDPAAPSSDVLDGGAGVDSVSYAQRDTPVVVDLADPGPDGAPGEGDELLGVESVTGGTAADVLVGDGGRNSLYAAGGSSTSSSGDVLRGNGGDDLLAGAGGDDSLMAGTGTDRLGGGGGADRLLGGAGADERVRSAGAAASPGPSCDCGRAAG